MPSTHTILVTGATGNVGRHVVSGLHALGADVRAMVRTPETADLPEGVEVVYGDLTQPATLEQAADGTASVFLLWPSTDISDAPAAVEVFARHASRIVYLSALEGPTNQRPNGHWGDVEDLVTQSGREWTFLRPGGLAANVLGWADQIRTGVVRWPYGNAGRSLIHEADIADVAIRALTEDGHVGAAYPLTGPEVLTQAEQVRIIGETIGAPVRWEEQPIEEARENLTTAWGDPAFVDMALAAWAEMVDTPEQVVATAEAVTGTPARPFRQWARDHADDFR
ncbi:SDR family oxidoreductase [Ruania halotolerans]|uniref:SDR family oxidoreductase n=1 Tax=Ruania halotolerans TaxID=2897773 RepID=UPI001E2976D9|nr:NAD(P)H-binding protein [Ruania halotolerans]UFU06493.1 NAD(P)H-binding protein [Ruania halotolerans]